METLYIPVNIKTHFEFFSGYGVAELAITGLVTLIVGVIAFIIHFAANSVTVPTKPRHFCNQCLQRVDIEASNRLESRLQNRKI